MDVSYSRDRSAKNFKIFRSASIPKLLSTSSPIHKHEYAEIHILERGSVKFNIDGDEYTLSAGDAILIPNGTYHLICTSDEKRRHYAFQADLHVTETVKKHFPEGLITDLFTRMMNGESGINTLYYICTELVGIQTYTLEKSKDYKHAIGHFIDKRHSENVTVKDLADTLHLSVMQTQRLVKKHTGMTFGENIRSYRMKVADYLMETTDMTLEEIAREVGYSSYSGFWKARNKIDRLK